MSIELISENEISKFYFNDSTRQLTEYAREKDLKLTCYIAEKKQDGFKEYILVDKEQNPIYSNTSFESICYRIDILKKIDINP